MGGGAKGLLHPPHDPRTIVERLADLARAHGLEWHLVGDHSAYDAIDARPIFDDPPGIGPLGGLRAALASAPDRDWITLACDLPFVAPSVVDKLARASTAKALAPRVDGRWQPLCARYAPAAREAVERAIAAGRHSLQALLDELRADELALTDLEAASLRDWDTPGDVERDSQGSD